MTRLIAHPAARPALLAFTLLCFAATCAAADPEPFPGTRPLTLKGPLDVLMVDGINRFALRALAGSA